VLNHPPKAVARALAPGGTFIPNSTGYTGGLFAGLPRMARAALMGLGPATVRTVTPAVTRQNLTALLQLLQSGQVKAVIAQTYPLGQAAQAITHMLGHHPGGKIAITA
jgi:NADPH:quinone reductase-like Zn-dependent oxidoreductase